MRKSIYVVLGMSRTGTSAIARSLLTLGIDLGHRFIAPGELNPTGFWEDKDILHKINRGVSAAINHTYMYSTSYSVRKIKEDALLNAYRMNAISLLRERLKATDYWGFKDPRTVTLMPFWKSVFESMNLEEKYIIVVRNPLAAALSNQKFIHCDLEEAVLIWLQQLYCALAETEGKRRIVVSFDAMLNNPYLQLQRMHQQLQLPKPLDAEAVNTYANEFLDVKLRHYDVSDEDFLNHPLAQFAPLAVEFYELLQALATDTCSFDSPNFNHRWQSINLQYQQYKSLYLYTNILLKRNHSLQDKLQKIERSMMWKVIYPLQQLKQYWRSYKRKLKEQRRLNLNSAYE